MSELTPDHAEADVAAVRRESPLCYQMADAKRVQRGVGGIILSEEGGRGHLNLRGDPSNETFVNAVEQVLGVALPLVPGTCTTNGEASMYWLAPNEWLVIVGAGTEFEIETRLRQTLRGHFAIVDVSGGQTLVRLSGPAVAMVLKKSSVYDFHPDHFPVGRCVQTTFAKATALVSKTADDSFDLVIRRSFADYLFRWLIDAAGEYGIKINNETIL